MTDTRTHVINYLNKDTRYDGRKKDKYREITVETDISKSAEGSSRVKIGDTEVLAGVKFEVGQPYPDIPEEGTMMVNAELIPMSNPEFEPGPPGIQAIELARVVDRGIRESKVIEVEKLCIEPGEKIWIVFIDIHIIDYDGNLFDAASLAALAALKTTIVPAKRFELGEDYPLPLRDPPVSCTSVKFNGVIVADPALDEEEIADARLTVATDKNGDIRAMQKGLNGSFTVDEIKKVINDSINNGNKIREELYKISGK